MAAGDFSVGLDGLFYYGTAGSQANTATSNVNGVSLSLSHRTAEAVRRGKSYVLTKPTVKEAALTFKMFEIESDGFLAAVEAAFMNKTRIALYPKARTSGKGLDADYYITQFSRDETEEEFESYSVEAKPTDEARNPTWQ